jgi:hypothetical protein
MMFSLNSQERPNDQATRDCLISFAPAAIVMIWLMIDVIKADQPLMFIHPELLTYALIMSFISTLTHLEKGYQN